MRRSLAVSIALSLTGCGASPPPPTRPPRESTIELVAESPRRWTGIAIRPEGRVYVSYPRWSDDVPISVAMLDPSGAPIPYPDERWNAWQPGEDPRTHWVAVQSVTVDRERRLWVLDPGNPRFAGVIEGAPKLVVFDDPEDTDEAPRTYSFAPPIVSASSYLNDVRIDVSHHHAYLTDSGDGALVIVDLESGLTRRVLDGHPSTHAEDITLRIGGRPFSREVNADGIALDEDGGWLYFQALRGRTLYRVPTEVLRDPDADDAAIASRIQVLGETGASDGLEFHDGRVWLTSLEHDAIRTFVPGQGSPEIVVQDPRIAWPDSFAIGPQGQMYFTTAQIHLGDAPPDPFRIFRVVTPSP
ncbi:major royal jelly family protein [Sandaracinus amylolyticus]|uniref:major royal jelly family protein n=1 Tax=Sandaracinus amylolyticus TaxID=927083 RepID=UPI001F1A1BDE|nr:major royal jelly family protein [Sandaracinus amylolyticus]